MRCRRCASSILSRVDRAWYGGFVALHPLSVAFRASAFALAPSTRESFVDDVQRILMALPPFLSRSACL
jgi:hypothetical protein